jgi:ATP synthase protein I
VQQCLTGVTKATYNLTTLSYGLFLGLWQVTDTKQNISKPVFKVVALQLVIAVSFAVLVGGLGEAHKGWSAAYGGAVAVIGSLMYALLVASGSSDANKAFRTHIVAETVKIFITVVLFVLALVLFQSAAWLWLILGFAVATLAYWFSLLAV